EIDARVHALQVVVQPPEGERVEIDDGVRAEVDAADHTLVDRVRPGPDDHPGSARLGTSAVVSHPDVVEGGSGVVRIEPGTDPERRDPDARETGFTLIGDRGPI